MAYTYNDYVAAKRAAWDARGDAILNGTAVDAILVGTTVVPDATAPGVVVSDLGDHIPFKQVHVWMCTVGYRIAGQKRRSW